MIIKCLPGSPITFFLLLATTAVTAGADRTAAELLPATTVAYLEIAHPESLLRTLMEHPLRPRIESLDAVRTAKEKKPYLDFKAGVAAIESQMGLPWYKLLGRSSGGGIVIAADVTTNGLAVLVHASDDDSQGKLLDALIRLARADAMNKGNPDPVKSGEYRGVKAHALDRVKVAVVGRWLVITNQDALGRQVVDRWLDPPTSSLATDEQYQKARAGSAPQPTAWGYVNTAELRRVGAAKQFYRGQVNNPLAELLFGGLAGIAPHTPFVTASVEFDDHRLHIEAASPYDRAWPGEARQHFFGAEGKGTAPPLLLAGDSLLSVSAFRDISGMWLRAGDLFDEKTNEELAKADSNLTTLFGGKDFGEDILGAIEPEIQIVVRRQNFAAGQPAPAIKLPSFALAAQLKDPAKMQPELRRTFQSLIGFLNIVGAMNGQPQLDQDTEKTDSSQLLIARYLPDANAKDPLGLKINFNFSPTVAFSGRRFVVSSTEQLARQLVASQADNTSAGSPTNSDARVTNTLAEARFDALREILADNRAQLVAQNMLQQGHTKEEAERDVGGLFELLGLLDRATLRLDTSHNDLRLSVNVSVRQPAASSRQ